ncbi:OmpP1/FadL family transporter [Marinifilum sp.]|uniref:OmpP1/FadL family transporter n=1 Tax=Marinifilum sp. TaxID=2033137 RepID=UPI003BAC469E
MKRFYYIFILIMISGSLSAQSIDDALRFSKHNYSGTARSLSMGGAFGALGGDFSSLSINPAGIAVYRSSEFTFTPSLELVKSSNSGETNDKYSFTIGNIGYVASMVPRLAPEKGVQNFNFAIGYNRVANFNREGFVMTMESPSSRLDYWSQKAQGRNPDLDPGDPNGLYEFEERLAYDVYLLSPDESLRYFTPFYENDVMDQMQYIDEKGYIGEYIIAGGFNVSHKFYLGASIGIQDVYYKSNTTYIETIYGLDGNIIPNESALEEFTFREFLKTSGAGVNFKIGAILRPVKNLRLGIAIHTPTYYNLDERYESFMSSQFTPDMNNQLEFPEDGNAYHDKYSEFVARSNFDLETPFRAILSGAYLLGKRAIISVDYEMIDYSNNEFDDNDYRDLNQRISESYSSTHNLRIGGELRVNPNFSLRGGYAKIGDPYKGSIDESYEAYSGGLGFKQNNFFFDLGYQFREYDEDYVFYPESDIVTLNNKNHQVRMTFGFRF